MSVLVVPATAGAHGGTHEAPAALASQAPAAGSDATRTTGDVAPLSGTERQLRRLETENLGADHAAEHATERRSLRAWAAMPAAQKARIAGRARKAAASVTAAAGSADQVGRWSSTRVDLPTWAINSALLPTGKVALWGRGALDATTGLRVNSAPFYLWDPATGKTTEVAPPTERIDYDGDGQEDDIAPAPLFCSGQSFLPSGELFVAGGNLFYPAYGKGHPDYGGFSGTYTFDPWNMRWTTQPRMAHGRWYPTQIELPDGRQVVSAGYDEVGNGDNNAQLSVFTPGAALGARGTMSEPVAGFHEVRGFYPQMQVLPGGKVAFVDQLTDATRLLDPAALTKPGATSGSAWTNITGTDGGDVYTNSTRIGGSAALVPGSSTMFFMGGYGEQYDPQNPSPVFQPATTSTETLDFTSSDLKWRKNAAGGTPPLNVPRDYGTLVSMPDGGFTYVGGAYGFDGSDGGAANNAASKTPKDPLDQRLKAVETWTPGQTSWRLGPAQAKFRGYHSTATLLPDGRILSAGDDYWGFDDKKHQGAAPAGTPQDQGEIYEPAYLFDGDQLAPRPVISQIPSAVSWREAFGVGVSEVAGRPITKATLVAPTAQTHSVDMNRGVTDLSISRVPGKGVNLVAPSGSDVARPGWYMLFAWDAAGTPSVARWIQLKDGVDTSSTVLRADPPTTTPTTPTTPTDPGTTPTTPSDPGTPGTPSTGSGDGPAEPSVPAPAPGTPVRDRKGPRASLVLTWSSKRSTVLRLRVGADEPGGVTIRYRTGRRTAKQQRTTRLRLTRATLMRTVALRLRAADRATLLRGRTLRVVLSSEATDTAGNVARRHLTVLLKPKPQKARRRG